jgi:cell division protein FtsW (lipid II flippase)
MKKKKKSIMVLGTGPVLFMTALFSLLFVCLLVAFFLLRQRDIGTAFTALVFSIGAFLAAVSLMAAYFTHKKDDDAREAAWEELEKKRQKHS